MTSKRTLPARRAILGAIRKRVLQFLKASSHLLFYWGTLLRLWVSFFSRESICKNYFIDRLKYWRRLRKILSSVTFWEMGHSLTIFFAPLPGSRLLVLSRALQTLLHWSPVHSWTFPRAFHALWDEIVLFPIVVDSPCINYCKLVGRWGIQQCIYLCCGIICSSIKTGRSLEHLHDSWASQAVCNDLTWSLKQAFQCFRDRFRFYEIFLFDLVSKRFWHFHSIKNFDCEGYLGTVGLCNFLIGPRIYHTSYRPVSVYKEQGSPERRPTGSCLPFPFGSPSQIHDWSR